jgi:membrane-bound lytic murein transglycosylase D
MMRAQSEIGTSEITKIIDEYRGSLFGYASMNFYSEFLAAVEVYNDYQQYFGQLVLDQPSLRAPAAKTTLVAAKAPLQRRFRRQRPPQPISTKSAKAILWPISRVVLVRRWQN